MLTLEQKNIIDGCLLGDGCLIISKSGKNPYFSYCSKNKDHVEYVFKYFKNLCNYSEIKETSYFDIRTQKTYTRFVFITKCLEELMPIYLNWYREKGKNIIPDDLVLSELNCLFWYIGDGGLVRSFRSNHSLRSESLKLSTHCFDVDDLSKKIIPQLKEFEAKVYFSENKPVILIPRRKVKDFLTYIGPCPVPSYSYKWNYTEYINKIFENKIEPICSEVLSEIMVLYKNGMSFCGIAKKYNLEPNRVKYYLIKSGIYIKGRDKVKRKLSHDEIVLLKKMKDEKIPWTLIEDKFKLKRHLLWYYIKTINNSK